MHLNASVTWHTLTPTDCLMIPYGDSLEYFRDIYFSVHHVLVTLFRVGPIVGLRSYSSIPTDNCHKYFHTKSGSPELGGKSSSLYTFQRSFVYPDIQEGNQISFRT